MRVSGAELLDAAVDGGFAVGSFNTYNLEITRAILAAAEARQMPVMLAVGSSALRYAGPELLMRLAVGAAEAAGVPVAVHLDHSHSLEEVRGCLEAGFTSIMVDGSRLPFEENVDLSRRAVELARPYPVEAELGGVGGAEDRSGEQATDIPMTDPEQAADFVRRTGVASLAVAIGNAHGFYTGEPRLDFDRLRALRDTVPVPLVLHGASGIAGGELRRCIGLGVRKINFNTEMRQALFHALKAALDSADTGYDVTRLFGAGMRAVQGVAEAKIGLLRSPLAGA